MAIAVVTPLDQFFDNSGNPLDGGFVVVQDAGTTTPRAIYTNTALSVTATNPIPLDSAGRPIQGMIYTAAGAYKLTLLDASENQIGSPADNIDPGVPIGSGFLSIANGGTGATTAETALSNLGAPTAAELADVAAEVAAVSGALGSIEKTSIAKGSTAQRPVAPATSDIRYNATTSKYEAYQTDWENFVLSGDAATQAQMEAASSTTTFITPAQAKNHPGVAKMWAFVTVTGGVPAVTASHNVTSVTDNGTGNYVLNLTTAFSSVNFAVVAMPYINGDANLFTWECSAKSSSTITFRFYKATSGGNASQAALDVSFFAVAFGDQ